jgi:ubiquitin-like protein ATG12
MFRPAGIAPLLKQAKFKLSPGQTVCAVKEFLSRQLHLDNDPFVYVNGAFAPSPEQLIGDLHRCHAVDGVLIMNYSTTTAWG